MAEAISVVVTDQVGIVFSGVDKQGIKTGSILSGLTLSADQSALVTASNTGLEYPHRELRRSRAHRVHPARLPGMTEVTQ